MITIVLLMMVGVLGVWSGSEIMNGIMRGAIIEKHAIIRMVVFTLAMNVTAFSLMLIVVGFVTLIIQGVE